MFRRHIIRNEDGVAAIEMAFAMPVLIVMIWMFVQLGMVYRALAGIQQGLGEGARYATLCVNPTATGCSIPNDTQITNKINAAVYGIGPGSFTPSVSAIQTDATFGGRFYDLSVTYTQHTSLLLFPGPDISITRTKKVWVATS
jgi:Flp pilus assembly protein TadG